MKVKFIAFFLLWFMAKSFSGYGSNPFYFEVGPEIYYLERWRDGGTLQTGRIDGVRFIAERWKGNSWYLAGEAFYSTGQLDGKNGSESPLKSELTDYIYEGRGGFTFENPLCRYSFFTLFAGGGKFKETNDFKPPSPVTFRFTDTYNYVVIGFLSGVNFTPLLSMGVNFKTRFMLDGFSKVSNDPFFDDVELQMNNETQYRLEIPIAFRLCNPWENLDATLIPFYEFRHFGGRAGFPFDYLDTKFNLFGIRVAIICRF